MSEQADILADAKRRIGPTVLKFYWERLVREPYFHVSELHAFVEQELSIAPASPDRILRALRQQGALDYDVIDRRASFYLLKSVIGIACLLVFVQPALACHHYRSWSYPWPQSCRVTSAAPVHHRTWFVKVAPEPAAPSPAPAPGVEAPVSPEAIETLNEELRWRAANSLTLEEKRNGD